MAYTLEGARMTDRAGAHDHLKERLELPEWYGRNLDALYDLLTAWGSPAEIVVRDPAAIQENLGRYGTALLGTLQDAAENNPNLTIILE